MNEKIKVTGQVLTFSEATRRLNPTFFAVGGLEAYKPEPAPSQTLDSAPAQRQSRPFRVVICVTLTAYRHRLLDSDNNVTSFKPLRDAVAGTIKLDDGSECYEWRYDQIKTVGLEGSTVTVHVQEIKL